MRPTLAEAIAFHRRIVRRLAHWRSEVQTYWAESATARDFLAIMRVRLSQSKVGPFVTPRRISVEVDLATLGPSVRLRSHTTDISVLSELLVGDSYEPLPRQVQADTILDLGANIGLSFRWLRARYPAARFVCVEPDPGNLEVLRANVRAVDPSAEIVGKCVGSHERTARLSSSQGEWGFRMTDADDPDARSGEIAVTTIPALLDNAGIDRLGVLKCDIEGAEAEVFRDCASWIDRVEAMSVECHLDSISAEALLAKLSENGTEFNVRHIERNPDFGFDIVTLARSF